MTRKRVPKVDILESERDGGGNEEREKERGERFLYEHSLYPAYIRRENGRQGSITYWERIRPNASTILCKYLHPLFPLVLISAYIAKRAIGLEEKAKR